MAVGYRVALVVTVAILGQASSCSWFRKPKPAVVQTPQPVPPPKAADPKLSAPPPVDTSRPSVATTEAPPAVIPETPVPVPPEPKPPSPKPARAGRAKRPGKPATGTPAEVAAQPSPPPAHQAPITQEASPPRLAEVLTPEQQNTYNTAIDANLQGTEAQLTKLRGFTLDAKQQMTLARVRNFVKQAAEVRMHDLSTAKSLSERALVLARDLVASVQ